MRLYESVFIARQDISTAQVESLTDELTGIITGAGGKIHKHEYWGLKTLAYRINKNRKGHYVLLNVEAEPDTMKEYGRKIGLNEDILRVLTIKIDQVDPEPSIVMQSKSDRSDSERGDSRRADSGRGADKAAGSGPDGGDRGGDSKGESKGDRDADNDADKEGKE